MVSFICDACGNTVKKTQVEKHYTTVCRNCSVLSCLDCGVDFPGDAYLAHTSCVTEAEKYQGHLFQAKDKENKGETKQKEWLKSVQGTSNQTTDPKLRNLLKKLSAYSNIPRKKKKFDNFCKNSVNVYDAKTLDQLWDLFTGGNDAGKQTTPTETKENGTESSAGNSTECKENGTTDEHTTVEEETNEIKDDTESTTKKKKKKKKTTDRESTVEETTSEPTEEEETITKKKKKKKTNVTECTGETVTENTVEQDANEPKKKKKKKTQTGETGVAVNGGQNGERKLGKKSKLTETTGIECNPNKKPKPDSENDGEETAPTGKFQWHKTIKQILREQEDGELSLKKLQKKVLSAYQAHGLDHRASTESEAMALCDKKIKSYPKAKIAKDRVKFVK